MVMLVAVMPGADALLVPPLEDPPLDVDGLDDPHAAAMRPTTATAAKTRHALLLELMLKLLSPLVVRGGPVGPGACPTQAHGS